ncbi:MAG TPA: TlpA family protein disulfide reductase [Pyrinomonadaceae bacterium]|jgi:thiol-disulfide isomerase/thioredoxin|nr:TlpA family protein disulfide reductase [Pyrinomonadaceae bacterium]
MRISRLTLVVAFIVLLVYLTVPGQETVRTVRRAKSMPAPAMPTNVEPIDTAGLKDLISKPKDKPLLVNFWATYCDPCRDEFPDLVKVDSDFRPKSLDFVTVSLDDVSDIKTTVPQFLAQMKATMPAYLLNVADPEPAINAVDPKWQGDLPATFLYNAKGEIVFKAFGRVNTAALREAIGRLAKN